MNHGAVQHLAAVRIKYDMMGDGMHVQHEGFVHLNLLVNALLQRSQVIRFKKIQLWCPWSQE